MERKMTSQELQALLPQLQTLFDSVKVEGADDTPRDGMNLDYVSGLFQLDGVLSIPVTVDGEAKMLVLRGKMTDSLRNRDPLGEREAELFADDRIHDPLTGTYNREYWLSDVYPTLQKALAAGNAPCVMLVHVDHYRSMENKYGEDAVASVVSYIANLWVRNRDGDENVYIARLSGHTLAIGLAAMNAEKALQTAQRLYGEMDLTCTVSNGMLKRIPFTLSMAACDLRPGEAWEDLDERIDLLVHARIAAGGDGVQFARIRPEE